jgi:phospholipid/cholesterol/gamma-HCH transport system substrate-binding protein
MSKRLAPRLIALGLVIVLGVYYIVFNVLGFSLTSQPFPVTVMMPSAGGLYTGASVTYRGVPVGTISGLDLSTQAVSVQISINAGEKIPNNGLVYVKELSALGEQYLDLQPASGAGPDLQGGTVIPESRVVLPTPIGTALVDLGRLLQSVNANDVHTVEKFLTTAFIGTGPGLRTIVVTGQRLFNALVAAQPETVNLVVDGHKDLRALESTDGDIARFSAGLASLTATLKNSNSDLRALVDNGTSAAQQLNPFLAQNSQHLAGVISGLASAAAVSNQFQPQVRAIFELLPVVAGDLASVASDGQVHGMLEFNTANTVCPYILGSQMPGPTEKVSSAPLDNTCTSSAPDMLQRGASSTPVYGG